MRQILMSVMLIVVAIVIYNQTVGGTTGAEQRVRDGGGRINQTIANINP